MESLGPSSVVGTGPICGRNRKCRHGNKWPRHPYGHTAGSAGKPGSIWLRCILGSGHGVIAVLCPQVFTLPKVSAKLKLKLTALEGSRVRRVSVAHFGSRRAEDYGEHHLAVLTNLGDIQVVSLPLLKPQVRYSCIRREDVSGIASCVFTKYGQGAQVTVCPGPLASRAGGGAPAALLEAAGQAL